VHKLAFSAFRYFSIDGLCISYRWIPVVPIELHLKEYKSTLAVKENALPMSIAQPIVEQIRTQHISIDATAT
jgi:hypothetical protein